MIHIKKERIPAFLRIDKDVCMHRERLTEFFQKYMDFDINELDIEVKQSLVDKIEAASQEFYQHRENANERLIQGEETNKNSLALQN